jgi:predicted dehydrogenase
MSSSKEKRIINIGVIGCGCISQNHVFSLSLVVSNARRIWKWKTAPEKVKPVLYALADIDDKSLSDMSTAFEVEKTYGGPNAGYDLINDPNIQVVFVLVPTVDHLDYVLKAAEKGKHVFCEKPLAFTPEDVQKMIDARDKYKVVIQAGLVFRSAPQIMYLKKLYEDNKDKWGKPTNILFRDSQEKPYKGQDEVHNSTWRGDKEMAHAGILFEHTIHDVDGMISVFGEIEDVFAKINYYGGKEGIEDSVSAILSFKNGICLSVNSMWNEIDFSARRFEIFFEKAFIMVTVDERDDKAVSIMVKYLKEPEYGLDDAEMDLYFRQQIGMEHIKPQASGPYYYEDLRFINSIVTGTQAKIKLEYGKYVQQVIEACYQSSREGKLIKLI